jgi:large subunit ribosomal protein L25
MNKTTQRSATALLRSEKREKLGTRASQALRAAGRIPSTLEWLGAEPHVDLSIDETEFLTARRQHQHVFELQLDGRSVSAIVRQLQWDVFGERIVHVEFRRVDLTKKTEVEVELVFTGHPKGVLNHLVTHVTVRALPTEIPDSVEVSVADLEPGTTVFAKEIKVPANVELVTALAAPVARISEIKIEILETAAAPAEGAEAAAAAGAAGAAPAAAGAAPAAGAPGAAPAKGAAAPAKGAAPAAEAKKGPDKK